VFAFLLSVFGKIKFTAKLIKPLSIKVTRIARGLPIGGDLEFADEATIGRAMINRLSI
ncbi:MAG: hypothetical protein IH819_11755, partial [Bacteroidetes bacterium]|nr:hypothetical protein [Bacteroidota bacterium]